MPSTFAEWDNRVRKTISITVLEKLPNGHGVRFPCSNKCGRLVTSDIKTCRYCRKELARLEFKNAKNND